jgi:hypothetical protein
MEQRSFWVAGGRALCQKSEALFAVTENNSEPADSGQNS